MVAGQAAFQALAMLVICTLGAGLIVAIPAAYLIGLVCTIWFVPFGKEKNTGLGFVTSPPPLPRTDAPVPLALSDFIALAVKKGRGWNSIREQCRDAGWSEEVVNAAFEAIQARKRYDY